MNRYFSNVMFQITSCFALAHLFFNFTIPDTIVSENQGVQTILKAMKRYSDNESLQTTAIFALGSIVMKNGNSLKNHIFRNSPCCSLKCGRNFIDIEGNEKQFQ